MLVTSIENFTTQNCRIISFHSTNFRTDTGLLHNLRRTAHVACQHMVLEFHLPVAEYSIKGY
jgi:hypothetical protein